MGVKSEKSSVKTFTLRILEAMNSRKVRLFRWIVQLISFVFINGGLIGIGWTLVPLPINQPSGAPFTTIVGALDVFQDVLTSGLFPFVIFGVCLLIGALFGRMLCGWICPFGFFQDILKLVPVKRVRIPKPLNKSLRDIRAVVFWAIVIICGFIGYKELIGDSVVEGFKDFANQPWTPFNPAATLFVLFFYMIYWKQYPGGSEDFSAGDWKFMFYFRIVLLLAVIGVSLFIPRFYCKYICPIGYAMGFTAKFSLIGIARNPARCVRCSKCEQMCEKVAMQVPILDYSYERVRDANCTNCGACLDACPHGAIYFKLKG